MSQFKLVIFSTLKAYLDQILYLIWIWTKIKKNK